MPTMTCDNLGYLEELKAAGLDEPHAHAVAHGLDQAWRKELATKSDVVQLKAGIESAKDEIALAKGEVKGDIAWVRGDVALLRSDLLAAMKADKIALVKWVVALIVGQTAVFTALNLLGH